MTGEKTQDLMDEQAKEKSWVSSSQRGETQAFNRLVMKWEKKVYNIALRMLQNREEAAEVTQEVFLLAFKNIRRFRRDARFSTWLYRITLNQCITHARNRPPGIHLSLDDEKTDMGAMKQMRIAETQVGELLRAEQQNSVLEALLHLQPDQQAVIELKFFQELTFDEIAAVLSIPVSTIKSRLYSGLEVLKSRINNGACNQRGQI
jgi:RNA polymerase sigma-70 factor (ECF subfamily)